MTPTPYYKCRNFVSCGKYNEKPDKVCDTCKEEARVLDAAFQAQVRRERTGLPRGWKRRSNWAVK